MNYLILRNHIAQQQREFLLLSTGLKSLDYFLNIRRNELYFYIKKLKKLLTK